MPIKKGVVPARYSGCTAKQVLPAKFLRSLENLPPNPLGNRCVERHPAQPIEPPDVAVYGFIPFTTYGTCSMLSTICNGMLTSTDSPLIVASFNFSATCCHRLARVSAGRCFSIYRPHIGERARRHDVEDVEQPGQRARPVGSRRHRSPCGRALPQSLSLGLRLVELSETSSFWARVIHV